jgi:hypothetical protein
MINKCGKECYKRTKQGQVQPNHRAVVLIGEKNIVNKKTKGNDDRSIK